MLRSPRLRVLGVVLAVSGGLVACHKPSPTITVFGGHTAVTVPAVFYAQPGGPVRNYSSDYSAAPTITVAPGTQLLVDVPRSVAHNAWLVAAVRLASDGSQTAVDGAGSGTIRDLHSTVVSTTPAGRGSTYYLQVGELRGSTQPSGGWVMRVRTTA